MAKKLTEKEIIETPKIDLHCHLDGSVSPQTLFRLGQEQGILEEGDTLERLTQRVSVPADCTNLAEYLSCFANILPFLQTEKALAAAAYDVLKQAAEENTVYIEIRFAPGYFTGKGLTMEQATIAVLKGMKQAEADFGIYAGAILCIMRGEEQLAEEILSLCVKYSADGVCGVDLAGNEAAYPTAEYNEIFNKAIEKGICVTMHSGECGNAENVVDAVAIGARRIGHGIAIAGDEEALRICRKVGAVLEVCPISNTQTRAVKDVASHPVIDLYNDGVKVTINTDNRTVSSTSLTREWQALAAAFPELTRKDMLNMGAAALQAAFLPEDVKESLMNKHFVEAAEL